MVENPLKAICKEIVKEYWENNRYIEREGQNMANKLGKAI